MYTCFLHPRYEHGEQNLSDPCPECGRPYSWPLDHPPSQIGAFEVIRPLGRGFYAATYLAKSGRLGRLDVLKATPTAFYEQGLKKTNFLAESEQHMRVAEGTTHLAQIRDIFGDDGDCIIKIDGEDVPCYVAVLDYVNGKSLRDYLDGTEVLNARGAAQVAIDLLHLLRELEAKGVQHNDLHESNILVQQLPADARRAQAVDETLRAVAIDLGSVADASSSSPEAGRLGDLHQVARHLRALSVQLLSNPSSEADEEYRLGSALDQLAQQMRPTRVNQRPIDFEEQAERIRDVVFLTDSPWRDPGALPRFGEAYNAATLRSWYVPKLLVDPNEEWRRRISTSGPQLITGMRGCGKTMLLRALEIHGRAADAQQRTDGRRLDEVLRDDNWVGLYESATRLLDRLGDDPFEDEPQPLHEPHARLLVAYAREALQAVRHLSYLDPGLAVPGYAAGIGRAVAGHVRGLEHLAEIDSEVTLERALQRALIDLSDGVPGLRLATNPANAFPALAVAIKQSSSLWHDAAVLFLLDDVSTRNLPLQNIRGLWSSLLFKDDRCAFKMTTEAQTVEQLRSPGLLETAQIGRDIDIFYLDEEVNERTRQRGPNGGRSFIADILKQRADLYTKHPNAHPEEVLGPGTLESIARKIADVGTRGDAIGTSEARQILSSVYHGLTALNAVCVGDIGDVIALYETMLRVAPPNASLPLPAALQSTAFQQYSRRRLYHLNRRGDDLRAFATSFARAAHELLVDSRRNTNSKRLRQYASIHVQIDRESQEAEYKKILRLVDAGVFVFDPGQRPRLRSADDDPTASFILNYRKLFGLYSFIGLAERDRFELRGDAITAWLSNPDDHTTLIPSRTGVSRRDYEPLEPQSLPENEIGRLFSDDALIGTDGSLYHASSSAAAAADLAAEDEVAADLRVAFREERVPSVKRITLSDAASQRPSTLVLGLGFEERTRDSALRLLQQVRPSRVVAIRYPDPGFSREIEAAIEATGAELEIVDHSLFAEGGGPEHESAPLLLDTTGLTKSLIFSYVRGALGGGRSIMIAHTRAEEHWPLNTDIEPLLERFGDDFYGLMEAMAELNSGEQNGYGFQKLLRGDGDQARERVLFAAVTAKHERLLAFVERREYDHMEVFAPDSQSARGQISVMAADIAGRMASTAAIERVASDDLPTLLELLSTRYHYWYHRGTELEMALTGSKMHAVACAAVASSVKVAQCWYVRPVEFDAARFSRGTGETELFSLTPAPIVDGVS